MPLVPAKCSSCGAVLDVNSENEATICTYCKTPFITEKAINNYHITVDTVNVMEFDVQEALVHVRNLLENGDNNDIDDAKRILEKCLNTSPTLGEAYLLMLMAENHVRSEDDFDKSSRPLSVSRSYKYAMEYLDKNKQKMLMDADKVIRARLQKELEHQQAELQKIRTFNAPLEKNISTLKANKEEYLQKANAAAKLAVDAKKGLSFFGCVPSGVLVVVTIGIATLVAKDFWSIPSDPDNSFSWFLGIASGVILGSIISMFLVGVIRLVAQGIFTTLNGNALQRKAVAEQQIEALLRQRKDTHQTEARVQELQSYLV